MKNNTQGIRGRSVYIHGDDGRALPRQGSWQRAHDELIESQVLALRTSVESGDGDASQSRQHIGNAASPAEPRTVKIEIHERTGGAGAGWFGYPLVLVGIVDGHGKEHAGASVDGLYGAGGQALAITTYGEEARCDGAHQQEPCRYHLTRITEGTAPGSLCNTQNVSEMRQYI